MVYFKYLSLFLSLCTTFVHAQKENYNWVFGEYAGLTWNTVQSFTGTDFFKTAGGNVILQGIPTAFKSKIRTSEGCFNVSDYNGELLFYSDGIQVWEKRPNGDEIIANGTGLTGNSSSVQSGIILPYPGTPSSYIAVTLNTKEGVNTPITTEETQKFLSWSPIVKNSVTNRFEIPEGKKNITLNPPKNQFYKEIVNAVRHANKKDFWIVAPSRKIDNTTNRNFYQLSVYKVDENGVTANPILQRDNLNYIQTDIVTHFTSYGQIKFNKSGTRLALISHNRNIGNTIYNNLLIADFNSETGKITNLHHRSIGVSNEQTYSIEFDPSEQYVYITSLTNTPAEVGNRKYTLYVFKVSELIDPTIATADLHDYGIKEGIVVNNSTVHFGAISTGVDNRMYITEPGTQNLFVIPNPENPASKKIYRLENILPQGSTARLGLPSYASFYFNVNMDKVNICKDTPTTFTINITGGEGGDDYSRTEIDFGDNSSIETLENNGLNKSYTLTHQYPNDGIYTIRMTSYDLQNNVIEASSSTVEATVSTCQIKVNPHIRINL
ncbi:hypothetical protein [Faecalibacter rhinopitheci]|uniref:PKD domain-containing protein n=1 Tax=Faecalibacter rhinopitheci TaxID=2779678 RepID=A0A8J7K3T3_9FLAO|nr:hypothetical protein [Faecalibacter rhinopitheci]MBF0596828.1 hypothetical protein [Faecalibacter rhinopitheci]